MHYYYDQEIDRISELGKVNKKDGLLWFQRPRYLYMKLNQFPIQTYEKLRYPDTDRQGHVNNAAFATMFETGRVEILYDPHRPLASPDCAFVIVHLSIDFLSEIVWPGQVEIGTSVSKIGRSSVTFEQALFQDVRMTATANTVVVHMNELTKKSEPLNDRAIQRLAKLQR